MLPGVQTASRLEMVLGLPKANPELAERALDLAELAEMALGLPKALCLRSRTSANSSQVLKNLYSFFLQAGG